MQIRPVVQQSPIRGGGTTPEGSTGVSADPVRAERIGFEVKTLRWLSESRRTMKSELICVMVVCVCVCRITNNRDLQDSQRTETCRIHREQRPAGLTDGEAESADTEGEAEPMERKDSRMRTLLTLLLLLLLCGSVRSLPRGQPASFSVLFSEGTLLLVDEGEEAADHDEEGPSQRQNTRTCSAPSIQLLSSLAPPHDPGSPHLLVCLITGLLSPQQDVLWWVNDTLVMSSESQVSWVMSEEGGAHSATSVLEVSAAEWRSRSSYWCGTIQGTQVYRERLC
ncbi:uncharacterized protein LOC119028924 isoform X2 [Xyrichtys novacula]|uniref:Uncharacterized protein LOC119028924 isoform X2 n=1 Tax=Xyrichtys novacula TaxID=13765 RepID=A0AAV1FES2_XYRNO|nr:uncharacterized protein LOC119028924 isoform X2 [Xyrichtys novacula]